MSSKKPDPINPVEPLELKLERLYSFYNKVCYISPDPLEFPRLFSRTEDAEIVALLASSLAYGRVVQILKSIDKVLLPMQGQPSDFIRSHTQRDFTRIYKTFRHRFTDGADLACLFSGMRAALEEYGTLEQTFFSGYADSDETVLPACIVFTEKLCRFFPNRGSFLLASPAQGSACKRLFLCLRWLIRRDEVDLGLWKRIPASKLLVPLDTHMFRLSRSLGFGKRNSPDLKSALEITEAFRIFSPSDPVKYDFALTRFGIHPEIKHLSL